MTCDFLENNLDKDVTIGAVVDVFDGARMVCWCPDSLTFGIWFGGVTINVYGAFSLVVLDCFTDNGIKDAHDAEQSFKEWIANR